MNLLNKLVYLYKPETLVNGDTLKQLLVRSRYLLFKHSDKWTASQVQRSKLLFECYPLIRQAYQLATDLDKIFRTCKSKEQAFKKLALWYNQVEDCGLDLFKTVARSIQAHYLNILNFFNNRSTNASAESFNAKIKAFRSSSEGFGIFHFSYSGLRRIKPNYWGEVKHKV